MAKLYKIFFAVMFLCPSSSKHNFTVPLLFLKNPYLYLFCKWAKNTHRHYKIKNKEKIWKQHYLISFKKLSIHYRKILHIPVINFSQNRHFFMFPEVKTQLSFSQKNFLVKNPCYSCLIMKNWNSRKWPTLLSLQQYLHR